MKSTIPLEIKQLIFDMCKDPVTCIDTLRVRCAITKQFTTTRIFQEYFITILQLLIVYYYKFNKINCPAILIIDTINFKCNIK